MKAINKIWLKGLIEDSNDELLKEMRNGYLLSCKLNDLHPEEKSIVMLIDHYFNSKKELLIKIEAEALKGNEHIELEQDGFYASCEPTYKWMEAPGQSGWDIDYGEILFTVDDSLFEE
jgi:hypothetical protein